MRILFQNKNNHNFKRLSKIRKIFVDHRKSIKKKYQKLFENRTNSNKKSLNARLVPSSSKIEICKNFLSSPRIHETFGTPNGQQNFKVEEILGTTIRT